MERLNLGDNETSIDGIDTGLTTQVEHRAQKAEMHRRMAAGLPLVEVKETERSGMTREQRIKSVAKGIRRYRQLADEYGYDPVRSGVYAERAGIVLSELIPDERSEVLAMLAQEETIEFKEEK